MLISQILIIAKPIKYRYIAKLAREAGADDVTKIFGNTADQEVMHAFGHLDLLYPKAQLPPPSRWKSRLKARLTN